MHLRIYRIYTQGIHVDRIGDTYICIYVCIYIDIYDRFII